MLSPDEIKQVFFHCHHKDPNGFYANDVDIVEFGQKIAAFALSQKKPMTDSEVLDLMMSVELSKVKDEVFERLKAVIRSVESFHGIK